MSSPIHQSDDLDPALRYAPRWVRERASPTTRPVPVSPAMRSMPRAKPEFSGDRAMIELQRQLMLDPDAIPEPAVDGAETLKPMVLRLSSVIGLAALVAWGIVSLPSAKKAGEILSADIKAPAMTGNSADPATPQRAKAAPRPKSAEVNAMPQSGESEMAMNAPAPAPAPPPEPAKVLVASVAAVAPLPEVITPPPSAPPLSVPPAMPLQPQAAPSDPPNPAAASGSAATPHIDDAEIAAMIKRGKDLLMSGDIASARLLLRRAADAGNAEAALALGATFDPLVIRRLGAVGMPPDIAQAKEWYQRAADLGSASAMGQLAKLEQSQ